MRRYEEDILTKSLKLVNTKGYAYNYLTIEESKKEEEFSACSETNTDSSIIEKSRDMFYDLKVMKQMKDFICYLSSTRFNNSKLVKHVKYLKDDKVSLYSCYSDNKNILFVVKTIDNINNYHESAVGFELNDIRSKIPNIVYTYNIIQCNHKPLCSEKGEHLQLLTEYIPGKTVKQMLNKLDKKTYLSICLQILLSLMTAKMTHYDLHAGNVILKPTKYDYIKYNIDSHSESIYIYTHGYIATIIDLDLTSTEEFPSHVQNDDIGLYTEFDFYIKDIFTFMFFCSYYSSVALELLLKIFDIPKEMYDKYVEDEGYLLYYYRIYHIDYKYMYPNILETLISEYGNDIHTNKIPKNVVPSK